MNINLLSSSLNLTLLSQHPISVSLSFLKSELNLILRYYYHIKLETKFIVEEVVNRWLYNAELKGRISENQ